MTALDETGRELARLLGRALTARVAQRGAGLLEAAGMWHAPAGRVDAGHGLAGARLRDPARVIEPGDQEAAGGGDDEWGE